MSNASKNAKPTPKTGDLAQGPNFFNVPKAVRDARKRLQGAGPFDVNDQKTIIEFEKKVPKA